MATRRRVNPKANRKKLIRALLIVIILLVAIAFVSYLVNKDKPATSETILINEVMAGNKQAVTDEVGNYSDWIELYNPGTTDVSLSGWGLSDSKLEQAKWTFPDISIPAGGYVIVYCDNYRNNQIALICSSGIELFCKFNDIHTVLSKCRTNRWCWCCLSSRNL